jgi:hypothetical protein
MSDEFTSLSSLFDGAQDDISEESRLFGFKGVDF